MDDFLLAAQRFADEVTPRRLPWVGLAAFLEFFSWPMLRFTTHVWLPQRNLIPSLTSEFHAWLTAHVPGSALDRINPAGSDTALTYWARTLQADDNPRILELIGRGLHLRWLSRNSETRHLNHVFRDAMAVAIAVHLLVLMTLIRASLVGGIILVGVWLCAMTFATLVCVSNRHWGPSGFRRVSD
jgi:hypothetical protein